MGNLVASDITTTFLQKRRNNGLSYFNEKLVFGDGSKTYPSGGIPVTEAKLGLVANIQSVNVYGCGGSGYVWQYDRVNKKLQAFQSRDLDWVSFTPTASWVTNTTTTGKVRVSGDTATFNVNLALAGAPTSASLTITIPAGYTIDATKMAAAVSGVTPAGIGGGAHSTTTLVQLFTAWDLTAPQQFDVFFLSSVSTGAGTSVDATHPQTFGNGDVVNLVFSAPVTGFGGNQSNGLYEPAAVAIAAQTLHCEVIGW